MVDLKAFGEKLQKQLEVERQKKPAKWEDVAETGRKLSRQISIIRYTDLVVVNGSLVSFSTHSNASSASGPTGTIRKARKQREREKATEDEALVKMRLNANFNALSLLIGTSHGSDTVGFLSVFFVFITSALESRNPRDHFVGDYEDQVHEGRCRSAFHRNG